LAPLADPRIWGSDRLHLTADGHRRVALRVLECLGEAVADDWREPLPEVAPAPWRDPVIARVLASGHDAQSNPLDPDR